MSIICKIWKKKFLCVVIKNGSSQKSKFAIFYRSFPGLPRACEVWSVDSTCGAMILQCQYLGVLWRLHRKNFWRTQSAVFHIFLHALTGTGMDFWYIQKIVQHICNVSQQTRPEKTFSLSRSTLSNFLLRRTLIWKSSQQLKTYYWPDFHETPTHRASMNNDI
jgi:hypothetical protein